jgi:hypothetical protein
MAALFDSITVSYIYIYIYIYVSQTRQPYAWQKTGTSSSTFRVKLSLCRRTIARRHRGCGGVIRTFLTSVDQGRFYLHAVAITSWRKGLLLFTWWADSCSPEHLWRNTRLGLVTSVTVYHSTRRNTLGDFSFQWHSARNSSLKNHCLCRALNVLSFWPLPLSTESDITNQINCQLH